MTKPAYLIQWSLSYPSRYVRDGERQVQPGDVVDDLPRGSLPWLLADGLLAPTDLPLTPLPQEIPPDAQLPTRL